VLAPLVFRRLSSQVNNLAQRLELAIETQDWRQVQHVTGGLSAMLLDMHMCRVGECACHGRRKGTLLEVRA
jgi:hypothetical protein